MYIYFNVGDLDERDVIFRFENFVDFLPFFGIDSKSSQFMVLLVPSLVITLSDECFSPLSFLLKISFFVYLISFSPCTASFISLINVLLVSSFPRNTIDIECILQTNPSEEFDILLQHLNAYVFFGFN